jgi:hypothetical protein
MTAELRAARNAAKTGSNPLSQLFATRSEREAIEFLTQGICDCLVGVPKTAKRVRLLAVNLLKCLSNVHVLSALRDLGDGEESELSHRVRVALDAARAMAADIASEYQEEGSNLRARLRQLSRKPERESIEFAQEVDQLRTRGLSWKEVAARMVQLHWRGLGLSTDSPGNDESSRVREPCRTQHRRHVRGKKDKPRRRKVDSVSTPVVQSRKARASRADQRSHFSDTDVANGRRFVADHGADVRFVADWKRWVVYDPALKADPGLEDWRT